MVELDRCEVELVTDENYTKYATTVDGSLDVYLKGGEGADSIHKKGQLQSVPATQTSNDNSDHDDTSLNAPFEDAPSLESQSQVTQAMTAHQPKSDDTKPAKQPRNGQPILLNHLRNQKHQTTESQQHLMQCSQNQLQQLSQEQ